MECNDCGHTDDHAFWCMTEAFRAAQEKAWDEGYMHADNGQSEEDNPYRAE